VSFVVVVLITSLSTQSENFWIQPGIWPPYTILRVPNAQFCIIWVTSVTMCRLYFLKEALKYKLDIYIYIYIYIYILLRVKATKIAYFKT
jgi:hypothetical protein